ncbi:MAG: GNAT family N-acetyltransferase, partial [Erysipelotrichaceae bacterium]|nr:GNAT family N-acetyltransferase [Erysipelotrichaceae bacterium]
MKDSKFLLRTEVTIDDALKLIKWLNDPMVIKYLNEADNVITYLKWLINNVNLELLTPTLNENGKFYIIKSELEQAIGFARLLKKGSGHEIVIVIGERDYWHRSYGTRVIDQLLKIAFLDLRSSYLIAKIHYDNH